MDWVQEKEKWQPVIGLEIHVQLNTQSKMFSSESYHFGDEPNTHIGVVSTGQPGSLPTINRKAVEQTVLFGCAVQAKVSLMSHFDRKSYFYPDTPKNYQVTQFNCPLLREGHISCELNDGQTKHFKIHHAHLEEDSGVLKHFTHFSGVDYNRSGVPILEIVSEACLHSAQEAVAYAMAIKAIVEYLDISRGNMEEGCLRMDTNISVRRKETKELRNKIEIKNMTSFSYMETAITSEIERQIQFYSLHPEEEIESGTYRFEQGTKELVLMRTKEQAEDYRYFPEPDLPPIILTEKYIDSIRRLLPELPRDRHRRYLLELHLPRQATILLVNEKKLSDYFEEGLKECSQPRALANWLTVEFPGRLKELGKKIWSSGIPCKQIAELVNLIEQGRITGKIAKSIADEMVKEPGVPPEVLIQRNSLYQPVHDTAQVEQIIDRVLEKNPTSIADYLSGKKKAFSFLVGEVMKHSSGKAPPNLVNELLLKKIHNRTDFK